MHKPVQPAQQGTFKISISAGIQLYDLKRDTGNYNRAGIIGLEIGVNYFYRENKFLSYNTGGGVATELDLKSSSYDSAHLRETGATIYTSIRDNFTKGIFDIGYGLSFSYLSWAAAPFYSSLNLPTHTVRTIGMGLSFSAHIRLTPGFKIGLLYQPNLLNINRSPTFEYQHYLSFHATWSFSSRH